MKVKEIISDCVFKLGFGDRINMSEGAVWTAEEQKTIDILLRCANIVYAEICTNYLPNIITETVNLIDNKVQLSALINKKYVYAVTLRQNGFFKPIKQYPAFIESNFSGEGQLDFVAIPATLALNTEINERIPSWLFADGVVSEYAFANNLIDIAVQYERKFRESIGHLKTQGSSKYVKARRWL
ncbi:MAG: hypothetical protein RR357_00965 [Clostridia bacterium]